MSLYAVGDLHLSFTMDKPMNIYGRERENHVTKIEKNWKERIRGQDTVVLTGDHSWGRNMDGCRADLDFITSLPGQKILLRGNHDMFWDAKETYQLNDLYRGSLSFLQNNYYMHGEYVLIGTRGYCYEGGDTSEQYGKLVKRELERPRISFELVVAGDFRKFIMFLYYPPTSIGKVESVFTWIAKRCGTSQVIYSYYHGAARYQGSFQGEVSGVEYSLVSSDYLKFKPGPILEQNRI